VEQVKVAGAVVPLDMEATAVATVLTLMSQGQAVVQQTAAAVRAVTEIQTTKRAAVAAWAFLD